MRNTENDKKIGKTAETNSIVQQKLAAFNAMRDDFVASFRFLEDMRGQQDVQPLSVHDVVRFLHAIWIEERKSCILSVARTAKEYQGEACLDILHALQSGEVASVIAFLNERVHLPSGAEEQRRTNDQSQKSSEELQRLEHGYTILANYNTNLAHLLHTVTNLLQEKMASEAKAACQQYGHTPEQIAQQVEEMHSPLYAYVPSRELAQQNMLIMNMLGTEVLSIPSDVPGERTDAVVSPTEPAPPLAEEVIKGYEELTSPDHNNINHDVFVDRSEPEENSDRV